MSDVIIDQIRATREAYAARFGHDPMAMVRDLRKRELASGRVILSAPPKRDRPSVEADLPKVKPINVAV